MKQMIFVDPTVYLAAAVVFFLLPLKWALAWFAAVIVHEGCHCLAVCLCGNRIQSIHIGVGGMVIQTGVLQNWQSAVCSLAGPLGGCLLLLAAGYYPAVAVCGLVHTVYNLLPIGSLDGARVLKSLTGMLFSQRTSYFLCNGIENVVLFLILCICLYSSFVIRLGLLPAVFGCCLLLRSRKIKIPCKLKNHRVQ